MANIGEVSVSVSADLSQLNRAMKEAETSMYSLDKSFSTSAKNIKGSFSGIDAFRKINDDVKTTKEGVDSLGDSATKAGNKLRTGFDSNGKLQIATNDLNNMAMQMNDLTMSMATGQDPFRVILQQGAQIAQIFPQGTTAIQALAASGASLLTFLVNPLTLTVAAMSAVAFAAPKIWSAFTGAEPRETQEILDGINERLDRMKEKSEAAANAVKWSTPSSQPSRAADTFNNYKDAAEAGKALTVVKQSIDDITTAQLRANNTRAQLMASLGAGSASEAAAMQNVTNEITDLNSKLQNGELTAAKFSEAMAKILVDPSTPDDARNIAEQLMEAALNGGQLESAIANASAQIRQATADAGQLAAALAQTRANLLSGRMDGGEWKDKLISDLKKQGEEVEKQAEIEGQEAGRAWANSLGIAAVPTPGQRPSIESIALPKAKAPKKPSTRGQNAQWRRENTVQNLQQENEAIQKQISLYSLSYEEREKGLTQLRAEEQIRSTLRSLGPQATQAQKDAVTQLITQQESLNNQLKQQQALSQMMDDAYASFGNDLGSALSGIINGTEDWKTSLLGVIKNLALAAIQYQLMAEYSNGAGGLNATGSILSGIFGGFRAKGGPVDKNTPYIVGERGPELMVPNSSGTIVPNNKLSRTSGSISGGTSASSGSNAHVTVSVDNNGNLQAYVERVASEKSERAAQTAVGQYNKVLPNRLKQIDSSPRRR